MKTIFTLIIAAITATTLSSCKKDKEEPVIFITSPESHSEHMWGSSFDVKATFSDDRELASYRVHIGDEAGEHLHEFHFDDENNISGEEYTYQEQVTVPDSIEMVYYLHFEVTDAEGKTASDKVMLHFMP